MSDNSDGDLKAISLKSNVSVLELVWWEILSTFFKNCVFGRPYKIQRWKIQLRGEMKVYS